MVTRTRQPRLGPVFNSASVAITDEDDTISAFGVVSVLPGDCISYSTAADTAMMQVVADLIAGLTSPIGTGVAGNGTLVLGTSSLSGATGVLATLTIQTTVTSSVSGGILTIPFVVSNATIAANGTLAKAEIRDPSGTPVVVDLTVGASGANINVSTTTVSAGDVIVISSAMIEE